MTSPKVSTLFSSPLEGEGGLELVERPDEGCHGSTSPALRASSPRLGRRIR
jgi:hypothetical protein